MPIINHFKRSDLLALGLILFIAALLRFGEPGIVEFFHDEAMLSMLAQDMSSGYSFPTEGILSSVGIPNPPTNVYVMWLPYLLSDDPAAATLFVAALNIIGVGLLWFLAYRYFNRHTALIAGLTYALSPWAVLYSRKIWAQDYHTPFLIGALLLGLYGFETNPPSRGKFLAQLCCLPLLLFALQIHFAAWVFLPLYGWLLWSGRAQISTRTLILSLLLSGIVLLPYTIGLSQTLAQDPTRITDALNRSGVSAGLGLSPDALVYTARLATGIGLETWVAPQQQAELLANVPAPSILWAALGLFMIIGLLRCLQNLPSQHFTLLLLWFALPLLAFTPTWTQIYPHYFIGSIPALALLIGLGSGSLISLTSLWIKPSHSRQVIVAGITLILLTQGIWWRGLLRYLDTHNTPSGFTTPLHYLLDIRDALAHHAQVLVISDGMDVLFDKEPARWSVMLRERVSCLRTIKDDGFAVLPEGPFAALIASNARPNPARSLYTTESLLILPDRPGEGHYEIHTFDAPPPWNGPALTPITPVYFDSGVQLNGYHLEKNSMILQWRLPASRPDLNYQYTGHFLDAAGERLGQHDTSFLMGRHWCAGDTLITWAAIELPEQTAVLRVGLYTLGTGSSKGQYFAANVLDIMGNPAGQWVDISLENS